jgi:glycosyltransferase involved in cell wall biosynthesis
MINNKKSLIYLGLSGFPYGMAGIQRQILISKAVVQENWNVIVICPKPVYDKNKQIAKVGHHEGIIYIYSSSPFRSGNFFVRNMGKFIRPINEFLTISKIKKKYNLSSGIVTNRNKFGASIWYYFLSKYFRFNLFINFVEIYKERKNTSLKNKVNDLLFNRFGLFFYTGYLPISNYIIEHSQISKKPFFYIPVIADLSEYATIEKTNVEKEYFMYCGTAAYFHSIEFILKAFKEIENLGLQLVLVSNGSQAEISNVQNLIKKLNLEEKVVLKHNVKKEDLYSMYRNAKGLLLPLFDEIQDKARFPHKLAEYLASGTIVLSNPIGEIVHFLQHNENVLFSPASDFKSFADNMKWVIEHPLESEKISQAGNKIGNKHFNYLNYSSKLTNFMLNPMKNSDL